MTQRQRVLEYMQEHGSITSMEAFKKLGVTRLSAVIFDLKKQGHEFDKETVKGRNRFKEKTTYAKYILVK